MQQTKRRGKKGVILLALAFALFVLAIVPASALAATQTVSVNNGATWIGTAAVALTLDAGDLTTATQVTVQDRYDAGAFALASPVKIAIPANPYDYVMQSNLTPVNGHTFTVRVTWYSATDALLGFADATVTFDNSVTVSVLDWTGPDPYDHGSWPGDYAVTWFGPEDGYTPARGTFTTSGATAHSVVYRVDSEDWVDLLFATGDWTDVPFYDGDLNGIHTVQHYGVAAGTMLTEGPVTTSEFGWDSVDPRWTGFGLDEDVWYGNAPLSWSARVTDQPGSGVATATATYSRGGDPILTIGATQVAWTLYQYDVRGTITPDLTYDAQSATAFGTVSLNATDRVANGASEPFAIRFDLVAPHTSFDATPGDAATNWLYLPFVWTNEPVTIEFLPMDPGYNVGEGSGVDYTEYFIGDESMSGPGTPTRLGADNMLTISDTAPTGPVYVWFRSVDNAVPANVEPWELAFVYFDDVLPELGNGVPDWWIDWDGWDMDNLADVSAAKALPPVAVPVLFRLNVLFDAFDLNSGLGTDLIQWRVLNWGGNFGYDDWTQVASGTVPFDVHINAADDGIYSLDTKVTDRAGNEATLSTPLKIDTRPPVTEGTEGSPVSGAASTWINGLEPYQLTATDQVIGAGVAATIYRVDQDIPWLFNEATTVGTTLVTDITLTGDQGDMHTIDFGSVDAALPYSFDPDDIPVDADGVPSWVDGNLEGTGWVWGIAGHGFTGFNGYKTASVKLDVTAPVVTAMDPKNGEWQTGPAVVNFSGTDVGAGYDYTEWSTDGGATWKQGEVASVGGDGEITVTYHGVDKVGIKSADQTIGVKVATTDPTVKGYNATVRRGHKVKFYFNVTAVTPTVRLVIQIRTMTGHTLSTHTYENVPTGVKTFKQFRIRLHKGRYYIRIGATDLAGNTQSLRGKGTLTVKR